MAIPINFDGRDVILPGSYSVIKSGIGNRFRDLSYGRVLIIDTGAGANFGGGSGVDGEGESGIGSVYRFSDNIVYRNFLKGGLFWDLSNPLFYPEIGVNGVSEVLHVKAAKTTSATITLTFTNGSFVFKTVDEGLWSNGEIDNTVLTKGYAVKLETSREDTSKYILKFYRGSFKGEDSNGIPYDGVKKADSKPIVILESDQFSSLDELNSWMVKNSTFNGLFKDVSYTKKSTGEVVSGDAVSLSNLQLAVGGTETYDSASLDKVFEAIADLDFSFILCDKWGDDSITANNTKILAHIEDSDTRFKKIMFVGGGKDKTKFSGSGNTSISIAEYFDSQSVVVVHGDCYIKSDFVGEGMLRKPSIYTAALALGRTAGLPPQIPITFKSLMVNKVEHSLSKTERRLALKKGVLAVIYDGDLKSFIVEQGINTLQDNTEIINTNNKTFSIQIRRIEMQINKELIINSKIDLLGQENGVNVSTLTAQNVEDWAKGYLQRRTATDTEDNLLVSYSNVVVKEVGDAFMTSYAFKPNREINKLFFTGVLIE